jgi:hypothetical protein
MATKKKKSEEASENESLESRTAACGAILTELCAESDDGEAIRDAYIALSHCVREMTNEGFISDEATRAQRNTHTDAQEILARASSKLGVIIAAMQ